ncbi:MAG: PAS domain-containing protein, partial [Deltaproteobacteria bacterium]|nr:PAS domain-containing protein [Deltaproteobacteria bacterium]
CALVRNITGRKRMEEALAESQERFRAIASLTPDYLSTQDLELRYQYVVNPQLGLGVADMIGKTDRDILGKEDGEKLTAIKRNVLEKGEPISLETSLQNTRGETEFFEGAYVPLFDKARKVNGVIAYFRNTTARKQVENMLRESEERWKFAIEGTGDGLWDWNTQTGKVFYSPP